MFKPKESKHLFKVEKLNLDGYELYSVVSDLAHNYNTEVVFNESAFNVYVDKENKILHIFDPLGEGYLKHARSVINTISTEFIDELRKELKAKRDKYDVYIYMHPVHDVTCFQSAYSYKLDEFVGIEKDKVFDHFINLGNEKAPFIF